MTTQSKDLCKTSFSNMSECVEFLMISMWSLCWLVGWLFVCLFVCLFH